MRLQSTFFLFSQLRDKLTKTNEPPKTHRWSLRKEEVKVIEGKHYRSPKAPSASSLMRGSTMREEPQVAGSDGYQGRCIIFHPFKNCLRSKLSKGLCRADPHCLLQNFNVSSWLRLGTSVQNWNLSPGGGRLTEWLLYSLSGGKWKGEICLSLSLWGILPSIKMLEENSWHQHLRSKLLANGKFSTSPASTLKEEDNYAF